MKRRTCNLLMAIACFAVSGCQLDNRVEVQARDGQLVFRTYRNLSFGRETAASVERLKVTELARPNRTVWELESIDTNGRDLSELQYGRLPSRFREKVRPEPLKVGQVYGVALHALGGSDLAYFVIAPGELSREVTVLHQ